LLEADRKRSGASQVKHAGGSLSKRSLRVHHTPATGAASAVTRLACGVTQGCITLVKPVRGAPVGHVAPNVGLLK